MTELSITTDFTADTGCPEPHLELIARAGFTHVHWCHQWNTDFLYDPSEIEAAAAWLNAYGLKLLDLHGSDGKEKRWASPREYERRAGVSLVRNRIDFVARLGAEAIVMHIPSRRDTAAWDQLRRSIDEIGPYARARGVRIAIENGEGNFADIRELFAVYGQELLGLCYDCGHGNLTPAGSSHAIGLTELDRMKDRLIALHLHDNDGQADLHRLPFTGTVDWTRLCRIIGSSSYRKCVSMESNVHREEVTEPREFLRRAAEAGGRLTEMINLSR
jgi:sugar phosphate isomerase/epimerase